MPSLTPGEGALIALVLVLFWLRFEARRVRLTGMLHGEPISEQQNVDRLQGQLLEARQELERARAAMDMLKERMERGREN